MNFSAVVATDLRNGIGRSGEGMLWHIPEELKHFKSLTLNHPVVMGRKTFETIGMALPNRQNIVLTRNKSFQAHGCQVIHSPNDLENIQLIDHEIMIIGGLEIYQLFWNKLTKIYQSIIQSVEPRCDLYFPVVEINEWNLELLKPNVNFHELIFTRIN